MLNDASTKETTLNWIGIFGSRNMTSGVSSFNFLRSLFASLIWSTVNTETCCCNMDPKITFAAMHQIWPNYFSGQARIIKFFCVARFFPISMDASHNGHRSYGFQIICHRKSDIPAFVCLMTRPLNRIWLLTIALPFENLDWINDTNERMNDSLHAGSKSSVSLTSISIIFPKEPLLVYSREIPFTLMQPASSVRHVSSVFPYLL